jgi:hypothetical protein
MMRRTGRLFAKTPGTPEGIDSMADAEHLSVGLDIQVKETGEAK